MPSVGEIVIVVSSFPSHLSFHPQRQQSPDDLTVALLPPASSSTVLQFNTPSVVNIQQPTDSRSRETVTHLFCCIVR